MIYVWKPDVDEADLRFKLTDKGLVLEGDGCILDGYPEDMWDADTDPRRIANIFNSQTMLGNYIPNPDDLLNPPEEAEMDAAKFRQFEYDTIEELVANTEVTDTRGVRHLPDSPYRNK